MNGYTIVDAQLRLGPSDQIDDMLTVVWRPNWWRRLLGRPCVERCYWGSGTVWCQGAGVNAQRCDTDTERRLLALWRALRR